MPLTAIEETTDVVLPPFTAPGAAESGDNAGTPGASGTVTGTPEVASPPDHVASVASEK